MLLRLVAMLDTRNIYPLSEFQRNTKAFAARLNESRKPIVLTVNGKAAMVIQDAEAYQELLDSSEIQRSADIIQERMNRFAEDGLEFEAKEALEKLRDALGIPK
jgi:PHD/YefM family antitoxin component YafN of YafNO toxin-antitoxin module